MPRQFRRGDVVELNYDLSITAMLSVDYPVAAYLDQPLEFCIPAGAHAVIAKTREGEAYLSVTAADDVEVRRWVQQKYLKLVQ